MVLTVDHTSLSCKKCVNALIVSTSQDPFLRCHYCATGRKGSGQLPVFLFCAPQKLGLINLVSIEITIFMQRECCKRESFTNYSVRVRRQDFLEILCECCHSAQPLWDLTIHLHCCFAPALHLQFKCVSQLCLSSFTTSSS